MRKMLVGVGLVPSLFSTLVRSADPPLAQIKLPPGFSIALWAPVDNARQMRLGRTDANGGTVFVGSMRAGKVFAVRYGATTRPRSLLRLPLACS